MKSNNIYLSASFKGLLVICLIFASGCKKFLDIPLPLNRIAGEGAYSTDKSTAATLSNVFANLAGGSYFQGGASNGYQTGLYTDELVNLNANNTVNNSYYSNAVLPGTAGPMWTALYQNIYYLNLTIEGAGASTTLNFKDQWMGEAYFLRAFCYFTLTNYYGDVAIITSSDFLVNKTIPRSPRAEVLKQIIADLLKAQTLLTNEYRNSAGAATTTSKGRPNKFAATALLARAYLYNSEWASAEAQASNVITTGTTVNYTLLPAADIDKVFLAASAETIYSFSLTNFSQDFSAYNNNMLPNIPYNSLSWTGVAAALSPSLLAAFEPNPVTTTDDRRKTYWLRPTTMAASGAIPEQTRYFPNKYKSNVVGAENVVLLRLAEQYLIRAEARARLNNLTGAKEDLDKIRNRAGLEGTAAASQTDLLTAILNERRLELFSELGHRFFDLRRTGKLDEVMSVVAPAKGVGATWNPQKQYFPIPVADVLANPNLFQTPGY